LNINRSIKYSKTVKDLEGKPIELEVKVYLRMEFNHDIEPYQGDSANIFRSIDISALNLLDKAAEGLTEDTSTDSDYL
jgi:hypothetical protein